MEIPLKIKIFIGAVVIALALPFFIVPRRTTPDNGLPGPETSDRLFEVQAIDTMKYSRDRAREALSGRLARKGIDAQMSRIKETGATHAAIGTPYDKEFLPALSAWVASARAHGLSVWFRGNFAGWEGWFDYKAIDKKTHEKLLVEFIEENPNLFEDGDVFSPCPECENGKEGDPRDTDDGEAFNEFLKREHDAARDAFDSIGKDVTVVHSMNADIARDVLSKAAYRDLDEGVLVDHYVKTPEQFLADIESMKRTIGENIGVGEFGAPIPDLQGNLNETEQATYIAKILKGLYEDADRIPLINYWTLKEGTTAIIYENNDPREAFRVIRDYFSPLVIEGKVTDAAGKGLDEVSVRVAGTRYARSTDDSGNYRILAPRNAVEIVFSRPGSLDSSFIIEKDSGSVITKDIILESL